MKTVNPRAIQHQRFAVVVLSKQLFKFLKDVNFNMNKKILRAGDTEVSVGSSEIKNCCVIIIEKIIFFVNLIFILKILIWFKKI